MADSLRKRLREGEEEEEETVVEGEGEMKRQCSFNHILSILESEEEEPSEDLSFLITTLQQELSSPLDPPSSDDSFSSTDPTQTTEASSSPAPPSTDLFKEDDDEEVMRCLLKASDGDLEAENQVGVPAESTEINLFYDGVWELEDAAANYYTWLQSELFMLSSDGCGLVDGSC